MKVLYRFGLHRIQGCFGEVYPELVEGFRYPSERHSNKLLKTCS
jgi:hypothetical protein